MPTVYLIALVLFVGVLVILSVVRKVKKLLTCAIVLAVVGGAVYFLIR